MWKNQPVVTLYLVCVSLGCSGGPGDDEVGGSDGGGTLGSDAGTEASDAAATPDVANCSDDAIELVRLVNAYRAENSLPAIPASPSLCLVGNAHVRDLRENTPDSAAECNLHSWSDQGAWTACCYTSDHAQKECMWNKPSELSDYTNRGYENAARSINMTPARALEMWQTSSAHKAVILNQGTWANRPWNALGVGIDGVNAVLWFGESIDPLNQ